MPAHDRIMPEAQIAAVQRDLTIAEPQLGIGHRVAPLARAHRVARAEPVNRTQPRFRNDRQQRMKTRQHRAEVGVMQVSLDRRVSLEEGEPMIWAKVATGPNAPSRVA